MSDRDRTERLIDELWPTPPPPPDMAARVLAALAEDGVPGAASPIRQVASVQARPRRPRLVAVLVAAAATAAAFSLVGWWASARFGAGETAEAEADGQLVASARQTVGIGGRAAA